LRSDADDSAAPLRATSPTIDVMNGSARVAVLSVHTSPLDQPGTGDSGGMNVYVRAVAQRLATRGVAVDVFTRCRGGVDHDVKSLGPGIRVVSVKAGPCDVLPKADLQRYLPEFVGGVLRVAHEDGRGYDIVHSHYWLSGWVGRAIRSSLGVPLVASFHTLGKVKNYSLARGEPPESPVRVAAEQAVIEEADRVLAPTPTEAAQLVGLYRADPGAVRLVPPGVDHLLFSPGDRAAARASLHLSGLRLALFVGRLQPHKGPDVAIRTLAEAIARDTEVAGDLVLAIVGGPSGPEKGAEVARLLELASALGVSDRVMLFPPQPQSKLVDFYRAADVVLVPSRSESFGLVALEAQACGTPVVAADVGGLPFVVADGRSGYLVEGHDPADHADRLIQILREPRLQSALGDEAVSQALGFTWEATADQMVAIYDEVLGESHPR
jgi:D-inositol-3-phosphate glycosyltransferase